MSDAIRGTFQIVNLLGLHARAAATLVRVTSRYKAGITLTKDGQSVNGKSILGIMTLAAARGSFVTVVCEGEDAREALDAIEACIASRFGEGE
ncbi:MAG: HPr family phosphocarrier protein [Myxococcales bacterium]|nr:HPr family phosphocarrier protein [Myxococcales bacterium]MCB9548625.1 HPr family phosphocarrier protein [Myxococcales bacterium]